MDSFSWDPIWTFIARISACYILLTTEVKIKFFHYSWQQLFANLKIIVLSPLNILQVVQGSEIFS